MPAVTGRPAVQIRHEILGSRRKVTDFAAAWSIVHSRGALTRNLNHAQRAARSLLLLRGRACSARRTGEGSAQREPHRAGRPHGTGTFLIGRSPGPSSRLVGRVPSTALSSMMSSLRFTRTDTIDPGCLSLTLSDSSFPPVIGSWSSARITSSTRIPADAAGPLASTRTTLAWGSTAVFVPVSRFQLKPSVVTATPSHASPWASASWAAAARSSNATRVRATFMRGDEPAMLSIPKSCWLIGRGAGRNRMWAQNPAADPFLSRRYARRSNSAVGRRQLRIAGRGDFPAAQARPSVSNMEEASASRLSLPAHTTNWKAWK